MPAVWSIASASNREPCPEASQSTATSTASTAIVTVSVAAVPTRRQPAEVQDAKPIKIPKAVIDEIYASRLVAAESQIRSG